MDIRTRVVSDATVRCRMSNKKKQAKGMSNEPVAYWATAELEAKQTAEVCNSCTSYFNFDGTSALYFPSILSRQSGKFTLTLLWYHEKSYVNSTMGSI